MRRHSDAAFPSREKTDELLEHVKRILDLGPEVERQQRRQRRRQHHQHQHQQQPEAAEDLILQLEVLLQHLRSEGGGADGGEDAAVRKRRSDFGLDPDGRKVSFGFARGETKYGPTRQ